MPDGVEDRMGRRLGSAVTSSYATLVRTELITTWRPVAFLIVLRPDGFLCLVVLLRQRIVRTVVVVLSALLTCSPIVAKTTVKGTSVITATTKVVPVALKERLLSKGYMATYAVLAHTRLVAYAVGTLQTGAVNASTTDGVPSFLVVIARRLARATLNPVSVFALRPDNVLRTSMSSS